MNSNLDIGLTHIALPVADVDRSTQFYAQYAGMQVVHRRVDAVTEVAASCGSVISLAPLFLF